MRRSVLILGLLAGCAAPDPATPAHPFDGSWAVTITCATAADDARSYVFRFPAEIRQSQLRGEHNRSGSAGWLLLRGPIRADGQATLVAEGLTGDVTTSVGRVPTLTPYGYTARVQFQARTGQGRRVELRPCALDFVKQ